ncbi:MAG: hypothetical protein AAF636_17765 [Pseudomonadota bacterium]
MTDDMDHMTTCAQTTDTDRSRPPGCASPKVLKVDVERYQHLLDDPALSEEQKNQIIEALWSIIVNFVELGFGVHPVQEACGQGSCEDGEAGALGVKSDHNPAQPYEH